MTRQFSKHSSSSNHSVFSNELANATGPIDYGFTNDYMFRAILQKNMTVLKALISTLLHIKMEDITEIRIQNPIELGKTIENRDFILDIHLIINNSHAVNLEMQVADEHDWPERSLSYLCRSFDQLNESEAYRKAKPVIHIGFLNYTLFQDAPEFYAKYYMINVKNHRIYSDKLALYVVDLTHTDLASDEDREWQIDFWAKLFKTTTWEELRMISRDNKYMTEASEELYELNSDDAIRARCRARKDYYNNLRQTQEDFAALQAEIAEKDATIKEKDTLIAALQAQLAEKEAQLKKGEQQ